MENEDYLYEEEEQEPGLGSEDRRVWFIIAFLAFVLTACICVLGLVISYFLFYAEEDVAQPAMVQPVPVPLERIQDVNWHWAELIENDPEGQSSVAQPERYTLVLQPDGQYLFRADCNVGSGSYTADGVNLSLQLGPVTLAECGPASLSNEYVNLLGSVISFGQQEDHLLLGLQDQVGNMVFVSGGATQPPPMAGSNATLQPAPPTPTMGVMPLAIPVFPPAAQIGEELTFDGSQSQPGSSPIVSYRWEFGDGAVLEAATVNHAFTTPGVYPVTLVVGAEDGLGSSATGQIAITEMQPPEATQPPEPTPVDGSPDALVGPVWRWSELIEGGAPTLVPNPGDYTLSFDPAFVFQLKAGCITGSGTYAVDGERIRLDVGGISRAGCEPEPLSDQYLALLGMVEEYELDEGLLLLYPTEGADRMVFVP